MTGDLTPDVPYVVNPEAIGDPGQQPVVQIPEGQRLTWRRLINNNRRASGLAPQCPCCEGDESAVDHRDLCDICLAAALAGVYPHGCPRAEDQS